MISEKMTGKIINCAFKVHNTLGAGFLEKVYENAMVIELRKNGFHVEKQYSIPVFYEGVQVGEYYADLFVNKELLIELKAVENIIPNHEVQLVNYLAGTGLDIGLLINFGSLVVVKKKFRTYKKRQN